MQNFWRSCFLVILLAVDANSLPDAAAKSGASRKLKSKDGMHIRYTSQVQPIDNVSDNTMDSEKNNVPISVKSILLPRRIKISSLMQIICSFFGMRALVLCLRTAGIPHLHTIWRIINGNSEMPPDYLPSSLDIKLAHALAAQSKDMIPPISLPAKGPLLGLIISALTHAATFLFPLWFPQVQVTSDFYQSNNLIYKKGASVLVKVHNMGFQKGTFAPQGAKNFQICELQESSKRIRKASRKNSLGLGKNHPSQYYFDFAQSRFYFCPESMACSSGGPTLHSAPITCLKELTEKGMSKKQRDVAMERYQPYNEPKLSIPTVQEAFLARVSSPLEVIQILGRLLGCLEDGMRAVISLCIALGQHFLSSRQAVLSAKQLASDVKTNFQETSSLKVKRLVHGAKKPWQSISASELLPGDVFLIPQDQSQSEFIVPVDALIVDGQCLVNESVLTGESVPQSKRAMDFEEELLQEDACLDLDDHKNSIVFAGTTLLHSSGVESEKCFPSPEQQGMVLLALRTGTYSSEGQLLGALKGSANVGAIYNADLERDAIRLVVGLSAFAVASCASLFVHGGNNKAKVPAYRRVIQCTRIVCASIPSDLPLSISRVTKTCSHYLRQESDVVCSEPGALLTAANVDTIVFDKTGTLTADTQALSSLVTSVPGYQSNITSAFQKFVLAGCHSLVNFPSRAKSGENETTLVGDPLDIAAFTFSEWQFNATDGSYRSKASSLTFSTDFVQLWQIRSFPFDPTKRLSSALVLGRQANGSCRLVFLVKGSPDSLIDLYVDRDDATFRSSYDSKLRDLGAQGCRSIAIGSFDLSENAELKEKLFPNGISCGEAAIRHAVATGTTLRRGDFESVRKDRELPSGLDFSGFACFDASIRPSSKRIIGELETGGMKSIMLTGDAIDSALSVGRTIGLFKERRVAILETSKINGVDELRWRIVRQLINGSSAEEIRVKKVSLSSVNHIIELKQKGKCAIAATGSALERVFEDKTNAALELIAKNLSLASVIARATPHLKKSVILCLKQKCRKTVLMCGDGANDVAAMKAADVSVAMLNGFGSEDTNSEKDLDDERRMTKAKSKKVGSNRKQSKSSKQYEQQKRMKDRLEKVRKEIDDRVASRENQAYTMQDIKDMVSATLDASKAERTRAKKLRMGGGDAAKILASERNNQTLVEDESMELPSIKPGEASLVAPFSCLHPSIDGVDSILRAGVAASASVLSSKKTIALYSLMAGYHLASLYKDGFRYGKNMWPVEMYLYMIVKEMTHRASCTSRPRLPSSYTHRPPSSLFHPSAIFSTVAQAVSHLVSMAIAVDVGRKLESKDSLQSVPRIRLNGPSYPGKVDRLLDALVSRDWNVQEAKDESSKARGLFGRKPYRANHESDAVFVFSILQSAVIAAINHEGKPFHHSILESPGVCVFLGLNFLVVLGLILESFPWLNAILEMRPIESLQDKSRLLGIGLLNLLACVIVKSVSKRLGHQHTWKRTPLAVQEEEYAADFEERLLQEESGENRKFVMTACATGLYLVLDEIIGMKRATNVKVQN